jgi:hypothetical protein
MLRLYPQFYGTRNAVLEKTTQNILAEEGLPVAHTCFICTDMTILGGAFLIMDQRASKEWATVIGVGARDT